MKYRDRLCVDSQVHFGKPCIRGTRKRFILELNRGIILPRITPTDFEEVHQRLQHLLREHTEEYLKQCYCVVEPHRYRLRSLPQLQA